MKMLLLASVFLAKSAFATLWITVSDPKTHKIGVVGVSSGYIGDKSTMVHSDNHGIAVVGSWYLNSKQGHLYNLIRDPELSAREAVDQFSSLINRDSHKRRVSFVNARFENASQPGRGCHNRNKYCGFQEGEHFSITGGGLVSENVILAARDVLMNPTVTDLPIECQMYKAIEASIKAGGEFKTIQRLAFMVDDVQLTGDVDRGLFFRKGAESNLLKQFDQKLRSRGITCPGDN